MGVIHHKGDYRRQRVRAYPLLTEQLDAIWKILAHLDATGVDLGPARAMVATIMDVKRRFPKS